MGKLFHLGGLEEAGKKAALLFFSASFACSCDHNEFG